MTKNIDADISMLQAALVGYQASREKINERIAAIKRALDGNSIASFKSTARAESDRRISAAGRKNIAAANRKRWAEFRAAKKSSPQKTSPKRKLSAAAKATLAENLKKARAARAANRVKTSS